MSEVKIGLVDCEVRNCITCGTIIVIPSTQIGHLRKKGGYYHCVNGHAQGWGAGDTEEDKIRRERDQLKQRAGRLEDQLRLACARADVAEKAAKSLKKKAAAGVCPCCHRTVRQMTLHMKTQHPDFRAGALQ